jgi:hypothetical protein
MGHSKSAYFLYSKPIYLAQGIKNLKKQIIAWRFVTVAQNNFFVKFPALKKRAGKNTTIN